jgi:hypothetical protein
MYQAVSSSYSFYCRSDHIFMPHVCGQECHLLLRVRQPGVRHMHEHVSEIRQAYRTGDRVPRRFVPHGKCFSLTSRQKRQALARSFYPSSRLSNWHAWPDCSASPDEAFPANSPHFVMSLCSRYRPISIAGG